MADTSTGPNAAGQTSTDDAINADAPYMQSYIQLYSQGYCGLCKSRCDPGCNSDCKARSANCRFRFAISPRPCPAGNTVRHTTPPADPSLPTTEEGISGRDGKRSYKKTRDRGEAGSSIHFKIGAILVNTIIHEQGSLQSETRAPREGSGQSPNGNHERSRARLPCSTKARLTDRDRPVRMGQVVQGSRGVAGDGWSERNWQPGTHEDLLSRKQSPADHHQGDPGDRRPGDQP